MGLCAGTLVLAVEAVLLWLLFERPIDLGSFLVALLALLGACLLAVLLYLIHRILSLSYLVDSLSLTISWSGTRHVIPLAGITEVIVGRPVLATARVSGLNWPGCLIGQAYVDEIGRVLSCATSAAPEHAVVVTTASAAYALSPGDRAGFLEELNRRRASAAPEAVPVSVVIPRFAALSFWKDSPGQLLLLAALVCNALIYAYVSHRYPSLPPLLPLHFNAYGEIDFIGARAEAFKIPAIGTVVLVVNLTLALLVHAWERLAAHLLLTTAVFVQLVLVVATIKII